MNEPSHFEMVGDRAEFRPTGELTLAEVARAVTAAITAARERRVTKLLVVTLGLAGFSPPGIGERYFVIREWARASGGDVRLALVVPREVIDPQKFGITVAANSGLEAEIFEMENDALSWLEQRR